MLRVTVEVWPGGRAVGREVIATIDMENISRMAEVSDYRVSACIDNQFLEPFALHKHNRAAGWIPLLSRVLGRLAGYSSGKPIRDRRATSVSIPSRNVKSAPSMKIRKGA